jgi:hypothetical protein
VFSTIIGFASLLVGLTVGWFSHRRASTWCTRCGASIGTECATCRTSVVGGAAGGARTLRGGHR